MSNSNLIKFSVGQTYPGAYPKNDGCVFEICPNGKLLLRIQYLNPTKSEAEALQSGFDSYVYVKDYKSELGCWVFKYPSPVGYLDAPFHAGLYKDDRVTKFLQAETNILNVHVLDGTMLTGLRTSGLQHQAINNFKLSILAQCKESKEYADNYDANVTRLFKNFTSKELYRRGTVFTHKGGSLKLNFCIDL